MTRIDRELQWRLSGYLFLAFFSSLLTFTVFIVFQNQDIQIFQDVMEFHGVAPDQYRIVPYVILKVLKSFIDLFDVRYSSLKVAIILFNFLFLALSYVLQWKTFSNIDNDVFDKIIVLFSFVYPISMFFGFRPVTSFYVFLISAIFYINSKNYLDEKKYLFIFIFLIFSCSRTDLAVFMAIFCSIYFIENKALKISILVIPILSFIFLKYVVFPESRYYTHVIMLKYNLTSHLFILLLSPLTYLFLGIVCLWKNSVIGFFQYVGRDHKPFLFLIGFYFLLVILFGVIIEFRLWMPFFPFLLFLLDRKWSQAERRPS